MNTSCCLSLSASWSDDAAVQEKFEMKEVCLETCIIILRWNGFGGIKSALGFYETANPYVDLSIFLYKCISL